MILRASDRFHVTQPGIQSWHCFSAGACYDPSRLGVGALLAVDEHLLAPGARFAEHAHRGVDIVSWVVSGALRHDADVVVGPGELLVQSTGTGIRHTESNASDEPLRLVQMTLLSPTSTPRTRSAEPPLTLDTGRLDVHRSDSRTVAAPAHLYVVRGEFTVGADVLAAGDSATLDAVATVTGAGEVLIWQLSADGRSRRCES